LASILDNGLSDGLRGIKSGPIGVPLRCSIIVFTM
jgi:hypothetical protein